MLYNQYAYYVQERAALPTVDSAKKTINAVFEVLFERITSQQARELTEALPVEMRIYQRSSPWPESFNADEFIARVARKEKIDQAAAELHTRAVLSVLTELALSESLLRILHYIPREICLLFSWSKKTKRGPVPNDNYSD